MSGGVCAQEECSRWAGDGGCPCAVLDVGAPTARSPWFATLVWTPEQNGGRVGTSEARIPLGVLWGRLRGGETVEELARDFGLQVSAVHVVDQLRREVDDSRIDEAEVEDPGVGWGAGLIASERRRQVGEEGWSTEHDARHAEGVLALAAACYALPPHRRIHPDGGHIPPYAWPWAAEYWKPTPDDRVRELAKAGALIAAEIDRLAAGGPVAGSEFGNWGDGQGVRLAREYIEQHRQLRHRPDGLLFAEHVSGVDVGDRGPSTPLVSPGPRPVDPVPETWHLIQLYGKGSFGYLKMTATAEDGRIHREDGRGAWEPFYDDEGRPAWFRVSREVAESWSSDEEEQLTAGDELALAAASVARLVPEGAERFRVQRAVRAWEEAR